MILIEGYREVQHCCFEGGRKGPRTKEHGWPLEAGKGRETDSPLEPPERKRAPLTPGFQCDPGWTSHPQVCKITMHLCCLNC